MGEWKPIETVPFYTLVLIWDGFDVCIANSISGEWISYGCDGPAVRLMDDFGTSYQEPGKPTHWMPVPEPPEDPRRMEQEDEFMRELKESERTDR